MEHFLSHIEAITLAEAAEFALEQLQQKFSQVDILRFGCVGHSENPLTIFGISNDFVMTAPVDYDAAFFGSVKGIKPIRADETASTYRSFARGEMFQLHPLFIERLMLVGSMKFTDFHIHTVTVAESKVRLRGWKRHAAIPPQKSYWSKTFDSAILATDDVVGIGFSEIRVNRQELHAFLESRRSPLANVPAQSGAMAPPASSKKMLSESWVLRVQREACARILRLRASGANPTKNSILPDLAKWCFENGIRTKTGILPSAETIRRHGLRNWAPPPN